MPDISQLPRAPIVEALLDIRSEHDRPISEEVLDGFGSVLGPEFSNKLVRQSVTGNLKVDRNSAATASAQVSTVAYLFRSNDGKWVVQVRKDGFALSRLAPYVSFEELRATAERLWGRFAAETKARKVTRTALRYINRVVVPRPVERLTDYFASGPMVGEGIPHGLLNFFVHLELSDPTSSIQTVVNMTVDTAATTPSELPIIFDIDVFRLTSLPAKGKDLFSQFTALRERKNVVFFESLTESALELLRR
ncbi:TIGR04255 family protein [Pseudogemmatithrix spongiicola]|uniref:TIGR04255 family protein n=1 Tax=Pseudogemmatithrix spongiicola TaxID=3062599 RepID=A0AA49JYD6_9BACT|nr:TIGR04255 family protein [Gemmatimonadaceae bacterium 'strain 138']WKW14149.1 TIGR04255 family protein [Gemmatimonadaceae bacterium 'strain 318']